MTLSAPMQVLELGLLITSFGAIVWGVIYVFQRSAQQDWRLNLISVVAIGGFANQVDPDHSDPSHRLRALPCSRQTLRPSRRNRVQVLGERRHKRGLAPKRDQSV